METKEEFSENDSQIENIYTDIIEFDLGTELEKLQKENESLENHIDALQKNIEKLMDALREMKTLQENLSKNMSSLFLTAQMELTRKDRIIEDLRKELNDVLFRRGEKFKRKPFNSSSESVSKRGRYDDTYNSTDRIDYVDRNNQNSIRNHMDKTAEKDIRINELRNLHHLGSELDSHHYNKGDEHDDYKSSARFQPKSYGQNVDIKKEVGDRQENRYSTHRRNNSCDRKENSDRTRPSKEDRMVDSTSYGQNVDIKKEVGDRQENRYSTHHRNNSLDRKENSDRTRLNKENRMDESSSHGQNVNCRKEVRDRQENRYSNNDRNSSHDRNENHYRTRPRKDYKEHCFNESTRKSIIKSEEKFDRFSSDELDAQNECSRIPKVEAIKLEKDPKEKPNEPKIEKKKPIRKKLLAVQKLERELMEKRALLSHSPLEDLSKNKTKSGRKKQGNYFENHMDHIMDSVILNINEKKLITIDKKETNLNDIPSANQNDGKNSTMLPQVQLPEETNIKKDERETCIVEENHNLDSTKKDLKIDEQLKQTLDENSTENDENKSSEVMEVNNEIVSINQMTKCNKEEEEQENITKIENVKETTENENCENHHHNNSTSEVEIHENERKISDIDTLVVNSKECVRRQASEGLSNDSKTDHEKKEGINISKTTEVVQVEHDIDVESQKNQKDKIEITCESNETSKDVTNTVRKRDEKPKRSDEEPITSLKCDSKEKEKGTPPTVPKLDPGYRVPKKDKRLLDSEQSGKKIDDVEAQRNIVLMSTEEHKVSYERRHINTNNKDGNSKNRRPKSVPRSFFEVKSETDDCIRSKSKGRYSRRNHYEDSKEKDTDSVRKRERKSTPPTVPKLDPGYRVPKKDKRVLESEPPEKKWDGVEAQRNIVLMSTEDHKDSYERRHINSNDKDENFKKRRPKSVPRSFCENKFETDDRIRSKSRERYSRRNHYERQLERGRYDHGRYNWSRTDYQRSDFTRRRSFSRESRNGRHSEERASRNRREERISEKNNTLDVKHSRMDKRNERKSEDREKAMRKTSEHSRRGEKTGNCSVVKDTERIHNDNSKMEVEISSQKTEDKDSETTIVHMNDQILLEKEKIYDSDIPYPNDENTTKNMELLESRFETKNTASNISEPVVKQPERRKVYSIKTYYEKFLEKNPAEQGVTNMHATNADISGSSTKTDEQNTNNKIADEKSSHEDVATRIGGSLNEQKTGFGEGSNKTDVRNITEKTPVVTTVECAVNKQEKESAMDPENKVLLEPTPSGIKEDVVDLKSEAAQENLGEAAGNNSRKRKRQNKELSIQKILENNCTKEEVRIASNINKKELKSTEDTKRRNMPDIFSQEVCGQIPNLIPLKQTLPTDQPSGDDSVAKKIKLQDKATKQFNLVQENAADEKKKDPLRQVSPSKIDPLKVFSTVEESLEALGLNTDSQKGKNEGDLGTLSSSGLKLDDNVPVTSSSKKIIDISPVRAQTSMRKRITPIRVDDSPVCSFENILEKNRMPSFSKDLTASNASPLSLTQEGEIPLLHLEENHFQNAIDDGTQKSFDRNIMNLLDTMNMSNLECDITKFQVSSEKDDKFVASESDPNRKSDNDEVSAPYIDKQTVAPVAKSDLIITHANDALVMSTPVKEDNRVNRGVDSNDEVSAPSIEKQLLSPIAKCQLTITPLPRTSVMSTPANKNHCENQSIGGYGVQNSGSDSSTPTPTNRKSLIGRRRRVRLVVIDSV